jgi:hypothetical protein
MVVVMELGLVKDLLVLMGKVDFKGLEKSEELQVMHLL